MGDPRTVSLRTFRWRVRHLVTAIVIVCVAETACGRKGPPLPPLVRVPQAIQKLEARRLGSEVFVTFTVPTQNVDAFSPADVSRLDLLALTTDVPPDREEFERLAKPVASVNVAPPRPDKGETPEASPDAGVAQGATVTLREALQSEAFQPVALPRTPTSPAPTGKADTPDGAKAAPAKSEAPTVPPEPRRYYMVVGVSEQGRTSRSVLASVPMRRLPPAPDNLIVEYSKDQLTLSWSAATDAVGYYVYRSAPDAPAETPAGAAPPVPLNARLEESTAFNEPVVFGEERCYQVRAVIESDGERIEGEASEVRCEMPQDTFAPAAPSGLRALAASDGITLRWSPSGDSDLGGYAILRGRPGDATLAQIAETPPTQTQYVDRSVSSGTRYVYAVVAFDNRQPAPNRSEESGRDDIVAP